MNALSGRRATTGLVAAIAVLATLAAYGRALAFDLQCDDLLVIRPWSGAELAAVWHGTWEPTHAFATFFRPLASWFYAGSFELFGLNATAHMVVSLLLLAGVASLLGLFVTREFDGVRAFPRPFALGGLAAVVYLLHPNAPWSTGVWITNDFHKLTAISALTALVLWQRVRHEPAVRWLALTPFIVISFLIKEDGVMLIPALLTLQWVRARLVGDVAAPRVGMWAAGAAFGAALILVRSLALGEVGGFPFPSTVEAVVHNLMRGPLYAFTRHGSLSALTTAEQGVALLMLAIVATGLWLLPRERRFLPSAGLIIMFWYDLPLALISNVMRYYMLTIASVMVVVPILVAVRVVARPERPAVRVVARLLSVALVMLVAIGARQQREELALFAPCARLAMECRTWVLEEVPLPPEARAYVADTPAACAVPDRPRIGDTGVITWGLGPTSIETATGVRSNEVNGRVIMLVSEPRGHATVSVRHPRADAAHPIRAEFVVDGRRTTTTLTTPDWVTVDLPFASGVRAWLRGAHRVDATFSESGAEWK